MSSQDEGEVTSSLKNIAAAHFIIVLAVTGMLALSVLFVRKLIIYFTCVVC